MAEAADDTTDTTLSQRRADREATAQKNRQAAAHARYYDGLTALSRLVAIAQDDTGQSRPVADFLLAWWNAGRCGGFDMTTLWSVDDTVADDMVAVFRLIADRHDDPTVYGLGDTFENIVAAWRPELRSSSSSSGSSGS